MARASAPRAVFFDLFDTLATDDPPQETLLVDAGRDAGLKISPQGARRALVAGGDFWRRATARLSLERRSALQQEALYREYDKRALAAAGIDVPRALAFRVFQRLLELSKERGNRFVLYDDVLPALEALKADGLVLGVVSNMGRELGRLCDHLKLSPFLAVAVSSGEIGVQKPHPAIFRVALQRAGVSAAATVFVGDNPVVDAAGARRAGLRPILLDRFDAFPEYDGLHRVAGLSAAVDVVRLARFDVSAPSRGR